MVVKTGKMVIYSGIGTIIAPLFLSLALITLKSKEILQSEGIFNEAITVAIIQSFSTFSITAHVLEELKLVNSELGRLVLSSALIGDILGIGLLTAITTFVQQSIQRIIIDGSGVLIFKLFSVFIFHPIMCWIIRKTPQGSPINSTYLYLIMAIVLGSMAYFQIFHQVICVGAAVLGFAVPAGPPLGSALVEKFEGFNSAVMMPVAVAQAVMRADFRLLLNDSERFGIKFYMVLTFLGFGAKFIVSLIASLFSKIPFKDSLLFAAIMTCRGLVELSIFLLARENQAISDTVFTILVLSVLISSYGVSIIVKLNYDPARKYAGYQSRNIKSLKPNSQLRILACIHKPDHVTSSISLLDAFHPDKERPIDVSVLHLIQLIGQATPVLMSHQKKTPVTDPRSQNVIFSFMQYQLHNWDRVSVSTFTAISPAKLMNEDISILALDKLASLILLPLHRRWSIHGNIDSEDIIIRSINRKVLDKAPCSVGIFFDRGKLGRRVSMSAPGSPLSLCMIFLGGNDDREALSLSKRIVKDSQAKLTVIRLIPEGKEMDSEEDMIDDWTLEEIKENVSCSSNVKYKEKIVKDGPETAMEIRSITDEYDLFLLGRRHGEKSPQTDGLSEWTELSELGIIGDLFASQEINTRAAVLVVQQQKRLGSVIINDEEIKDRTSNLTFSNG